MVALSPEAQSHLERYIRQIKMVMREHSSVDADEVERDVVGHIEAELAPLLVAALQQRSRHRWPDVEAQPTSIHCDKSRVRGVSWYGYPCPRCVGADGDCCSGSHPRDGKTHGPGRTLAADRRPDKVRWARRFSGPPKHRSSTPIPGNRGPVVAFLPLIVGIVSIVLIIACANLAGVLLARATARRSELALRLAIGAGPGRLIRQLLTETILLFALGGMAGLMLARGVTSLLVSRLPTLPFPVFLTLTLDWRVIAFAVTRSLIAALLSGLAPAVQASKTDVLAGLNTAGDRDGAPPVAIVSESAARQFWPRQSAVGKYLLQPTWGPQGPTVQCGHCSWSASHATYSPPP